MLCIVHLVEGLHGRADLRTGHLFVEGVDEAVGPRSILLSNDKGMELWITLVCLCPERQAFRHTQLQGERGGNKSQSPLQSSSSSVLAKTTVFLMIIQL